MGVMKALESPNGYSAWDYAQSIVNLLTEVLDAIRNGNGQTPTPRRVPFNFTCDSTGYGFAELQIPRGKKWDLSGFAFTASTAGYVAIYANSENGTNLIQVAPSSSLVNQNFEDADIVSGRDDKLVVVARTQSASQQIVGNISLLQYDEVTPKEAH